GPKVFSISLIRIQIILRDGESRVEFIVNDLSLDGQFPDIVSFRSAIRKLMEIRKITCRFGRTLYCHRGLSRAQVTQTMRMPQVVQALGVDERRVLMQWLTRNGPFWDDMRNHQPEDWLEWNDEIVTDTAIGEAAWCCLNGIERSLVSFSPSDWQFSPVPVNWMNETGIKKDADVLNYWDPDEIETALQNAPVPLNSWEQLSRIAIARCHQLFFAEDAFVALDGYPFVSSAAQQVVVLLDILNRFTTCFDNDGQRTQEGHEI
ncbi:MAG: hypothetical protein U9R69_04850, partial [Thermodesulfobacteriota bacterium]|nr:hypothetical protein [Thermodesulfobacteriota bacterium]